LLLSEILAKKDPAEEDLGDNFVADDETGRAKLFLSMTGSAEDPVVKYDTREVREKITGDLQQEREELRQAFRKEFGQPGAGEQHDAGLRPAESTGNKEFIIQWDETKKEQKLPPEEQKPGQESRKKEERKDFIIRWDERKDTVPRNDREWK
jgi:hypothetical protein